MKFYKETTQWKDGGANHTYLLSDNKTKMYAYVKDGTTKVIEFKNPIDIDIRGRKFVEVKNTFKYKIKEQASVYPNWKVVGSKGDVYTVELVGTKYQCSCAGFKFRHKCSHIESVK
jgi:hypothetical protein